MGFKTFTFCWIVLNASFFFIWVHMLSDSAAHTQNRMQNMLTGEINGDLQSTVMDAKSRGKAKSSASTADMDQPTPAHIARCDCVSWQSLLSDPQSPVHPLSLRYPDVVVEHDYSDVKCDIAIIAAGFVRSGSTLQETLLAEAAQMAGARVVRFYWQEHLNAWTFNAYQGISELTEQDITTSRESYAAILASITGGPEQNGNGSHVNKLPVALLIKSHQFDPKLLNLCRHQLVYTSHRSLVEVVASLLKLGWVKTLEDALGALDVHYGNYVCWKDQVGARDWSYTDMLAHPSGKAYEATQDIKRIIEKDQPIQTVLHQSFNQSLEQAVERLKRQHIGVTSVNMGKAEARLNVTLPVGWADAIRRRYGSSTWFKSDSMPSNDSFYDSES